MSILQQTAASVHSVPDLVYRLDAPAGFVSEPADAIAATADDLSWWAAQGAPEADFPGEPLLPFAAWIEDRAYYFRSLDTDAGDWLAAKLDELAATARYLDAASPREFEERREWEEDLRDSRLRSEGYDRAIVES